MTRPSGQPRRTQPWPSSSMKMTAGAACRAAWNSSRTDLAPCPTNSSMKSEPDAAKNAAGAGLAAVWGREGKHLAPPPFQDKPMFQESGVDAGGCQGMMRREGSAGEKKVKVPWSGLSVIVVRHHGMESLFYSLAKCLTWVRSTPQRSSANGKNIFGEAPWLC